MEWKPIETAPKDGVFVLGFSEDEWERPFIMHFYMGSWENTCGWGEVHPTHWMQLPDPPK